MKNGGMRILFIIVISLLILCFFHSYGLTLNQPDTVRVECLKFVSPQTTVTADVTFWTDQTLGGFSVPLTFYNPHNPDIVCDSVSWSQAFWNNIPAMYDAIIDSTEKKLVFYAAYLSGAWSTGDNAVATLYLTTGPTWDASIAMMIDSTRWGPVQVGVELSDELGYAMPYEFIPGCQLLPPVPTHTPWSLIILMVVVAGFLGYIILRSRQAGLVK